MRLTKQQLEEIISAVFDYADYDVETNGYRDYDITGWIAKSSKGQVLSDIEETLNKNENKTDLRDLFDLQRALQKKIDFTGMTLIQYIRLMFIGVVTEACEALEETNWKVWKQPKIINNDKFKDEIIDIFHFLINMCLAANMNAEEVIQRFTKKNKTNFKRQEKKY